MRCLPLLAIGLALLGMPRGARADDLDGARQHFREGVRRYEDGDFEGARALFRQSDTEHHAAATVYNIARAEERLGHPQAAVDAYEAYLAEAGEAAPFAQPAALALARVKASARLLRVESKPPGAHVFVDGAEAKDVAPVAMLVTMGRHRVVAEGDTWRAVQDVDVASGKGATVAFEAPPAPAPAAPAEAPAPRPLVPAPAPAREYEGFVFGAHFAAIPHRFEQTSGRELASFGLGAGFVVEAGYAPSDSFVVLGRALLALGSKGVPATSIGAIGVAVTYRIVRRIWLGASFQGGRAILPGAISPLPEEQQRFDTDYVLCPSIDVSVVVLERAYGQWLLSAMPGYYFAGTGDSDLFYVPIMLGLRIY